VALLTPASALAWSPLRAENPNAKRGNEQMAAEQYAEALEAYDQAARELPEARAVQLNRGLALLAQELHEPAKVAFTDAADPSAPPEVRADAYYDLGIVHAREGNAASEQEDFEQSSAHFREAADAFKRSLRAKPGNRNAAWNLEYALKRIREEEQKQEQSQEQEQEQSQEQEQEQEREREREGEPESGDENEPQELPRSEVERFLDALEQNEESLPVQQARRRNAGRRPPEKDW
jgi:tetratricopeptide (TPR) repeat protein